MVHNPIIIPGAGSVGNPAERPEEIWKAVGQALSRWEFAEVNMARLYCGLKGQPAGAQKWMEYGNEGTIFSQRLTKLEKTATTYFSKHPDQSAEGDFKLLVDFATNLAPFRHRVAHGIAWKRNTQGWWWLVPPWYTERLHFAGQDYWFSPGQIDIIGEHFDKLAARVKAFRLRLELP